MPRPPATLMLRHEYGPLYSSLGAQLTDLANHVSVSHSTRPGSPHFAYIDTSLGLLGVDKVYASHSAKSLAVRL